MDDDDEFSDNEASDDENMQQSDHQRKGVMSARLELPLDRTGEMDRLLRLIQARLMKETNSKSQPSEKPLLELLRRRSFWLRSETLQNQEGRRELELALFPDCLPGTVFDKLCMLEFFRDVYVWLPDLEFSIMPPCIHCGAYYVVAAVYTAIQ